MIISAWISIAALIWCIAFLVSYLIGLIRKGAPKDLSERSGNTVKGIIYSNTGAMLPAAKESAYMHLPTYTAGMIFHIGNFLSLLMFVWIIVCCCCNISTPAVLALILAALLTVSSLCGIFILIKRFVNVNLRSISCFDDFFSNIICTLFQIAGICIMLSFSNICTYTDACSADRLCLMNFYFIVAAILFIWMPLGKIKHLIYYFAARYHLGFFYGWRNTWPPKHI
ncbi:MAG: hypothetical protein PHD11_06620 [Bacteroidales bacterium]|nr:hypothetical protein [Bacteroidales bacterium]MDD4670839.1 hypothetical protein [Bacteroidales bacterium]